MAFTTPAGTSPAAPLSGGEGLDGLRPQGPADWSGRRPVLFGSTRLARWLLGPNTAIQRACKHWLLTAQGYIAALIALALSVHSGLAPLFYAWLLALYCIGGELMFYAALRSGYSQRFKDPFLTFPRVVFGACAIAASYGLSELSRSAALQLFFLLVLFDLQRLESRQTVVLTYGAASMLVILVTATAVLRPEGFNLRYELFNVAISSLMLPMLGNVAREVRQLRRKQIRQRTELEVTLQRLHELSIRDALTGVFNRRHIFARLDEEAHRQSRGRSTLSVALIDLDHFKRINDRLGHGVGDAVLRQFAEIATVSLRSTTAIGRWGGEEFLLVLPGTHGEEAAALTERLRAAVHHYPWERISADLHVSFSAGVCEHRSGSDLQLTLELADRALYQAKAGGRNQVCSAERR